MQRVSRKRRSEKRSITTQKRHDNVPWFRIRDSRTIPAVVGGKYPILWRQGRAGPMNQKTNNSENENTIITRRVVVVCRTKHGLDRDRAK